MIALWGLDPEDWKPHPLHDPERTYVETNCFLDAVIETVAAAGGEPTAMLGATIAGDFEIDQWTFCKPTGSVLGELYGIDVHEMQPYRGLAGQIASRLAAGQTLFPELDGFHLPDTTGVSYRTKHVKTSVVAEAIDTEAEIFRYFHNAGYFELSGADYRAVFRLDDPLAGDWLPYTDLVRFGRGPMLTGEDLRAAARGVDQRELDRLPATNPWPRLAAFLGGRLDALAGESEQGFHDLAFATVRMAGSSHELLASHVRWLLPGDEAAEAVAADLDTVVSTCKMLSFRMARRRAFDVDAATAPAVTAWEHAMTGLGALIG